MSNSGLRLVEGLTILPLDGLWSSLDNVPTEDKLSAALEYAGCEFYDDDRRLLQNFTVSLAGLGGNPVAYKKESDATIKERMHSFVLGSQSLMGAAAAFSYLNSGEKPIDSLYDHVMSLGHYSVAHTVQANFVVAGITEATEVELSLQRDIVHLSKLTNTRTRIQNNPPIAVRNPDDLPGVRRVQDEISKLREKYHKNVTADTLEIINGFYPVNKATILMLSGDLSNMRKLTELRDDKGKERELREVADSLREQLLKLWPKIFKDKE